MCDQSSVPSVLTSTIPLAAVFCFSNDYSFLEGCSFAHLVLETLSGGIQGSNKG